MDRREDLFMEFSISYLSFYVIEIDQQKDQRTYSHYQTLDAATFENSALSQFLEGELKRIVKRKAQSHPNHAQAPTKLGEFVTEGNHPLESNPNYALFQRALHATTSTDFKKESESFVETYVQTSAVRGGVFLVCQAKPKKYFDDLFLFILKCDFQDDIAVLSDANTLVKKVERAITTKNMKSIQYPYMIEEGMLEHTKVKIHQSSHARYFEDFLPFVTYGDPMPEVIKTQVQTMVQDHVNETFSSESSERQEMEERLESWSASETRELQEQLNHHQVVEATAAITAHIPDSKTTIKLGDVVVKFPLDAYGDNVHLAKYNDRYVLVVDAEQVTFDKNASPIEFLKPDHLEAVIQRMQADDE